jgi:hypothetical protein
MGPTFRGTLTRPLGGLQKATQSRTMNETVSRTEGRPAWAAFFGLVGGAAGGPVMLYAARALAKQLQQDIDIVRTLGSAIPHAAFGDDGAWMGGLALAAGAGALVGLMLGALMQHVSRVAARVFIGVIIGPVLWIAVDAFALRHFAPMLAQALPLVPMVAGAAAYGACVALIPPLRRRVVDDWT